MSCLVSQIRFICIKVHMEGSIIWVATFVWGAIKGSMPSTKPPHHAHLELW